MQEWLTRIASLIFYIFALLFSSQQTFAEEIPETFIGVRPLGMGGAFTAIADDENSVWTNPAGISRVRKSRSRKKISLASVPILSGGGNPGGRKFFLGSLSRAGQGGSELLAEILGSLEQETNESIWVQTSAAAMVFFDWPKGSPWQFGAFSSSKTHIIPDFKQSSAQASEEQFIVVDNVTDLGGSLVVGWTNKTNRLSAAVTIRPTLRYSYYDKTSISELSKNFQSKLTSEGNSGQGLGVDAGFLWTFADYWFPSLGVAVRNLPTGCVDDYLNVFEESRQRVCGTLYSGKINNPESPSILDPSDIRIGVSMTPRLSRKIALRFAIDLHHLYFSPDDVTFYGLSGIEPIKQVHAGIELFFGNPLQLSPFSLRLGFNQGFLSFGGSFRMGLLALELAKYDQDISSGPTAAKDTRYLGSLSFTLR